MNEVSTLQLLPPCSLDAHKAIDSVKEILQGLPQTELCTRHLIHAGVYCRSLTIPAGTIIVGVTIKIPTILIISGTAQLYSPDGTLRVSGYNVLPGAAGRRSMIYAETDVDMTMFFCTRAKTVQEAEKEFTDEYLDLLSNSGNNEIQITGEV